MHLDPPKVCYLPLPQKLIHCKVCVCVCACVMGECSLVYSPQEIFC